MVVTVAMMVVCLSSLVNDCSRYSQHRGVLVFNELTDVFRNDKEKEYKPNDNEYLHFPFSYAGIMFDQIRGIEFPGRSDFRGHLR